MGRKISGAVPALGNFSRIFNVFLRIANESSADVIMSVNVSVFQISLCWSTWTKMVAIFIDDCIGWQVRISGTLRSIS